VINKYKTPPVSCHWRKEKLMVDLFNSTINAFWFFCPFCLDTKRAKKVKEKSIAPHFFPGLTHKFRNYWVYHSREIVIFFSNVPSLFLIKCFWLTRLWFANTAGATSRLQFLDREFFQSTSG